jgi:hypothetical protein
MSTGATDVFQQSCDQIIADALTNLGACAVGASVGNGITGKQRAHAFRALNRIVKEIDASGDFLWRTVRRNIAITAGTASYGPSIIGTDVLGLEDPCDFLLSGTTTGRTQVYMMSNVDFRSLSDRTSQGTPSQYLVERALAGLTLTLWPVPNAAGTLEIMAALRSKDYVLGTDTSDYTSKWDQALVLGLSGVLAPTYAQDGSDFTAQFEAKRDKLLNDDNEKGPLTLVPWGWGGGYSGV